MKNVTHKATATFGFALICLYVLASTLIVRPILAALSQSSQYQLTTHTLSPAGVTGVFQWIVMDSNGKSHVVYLNQQGNTDSKIEYVNNLTGTYGAVQDLAVDGSMASRPSIAISGNTLHVAYTAVNTTQLFYQQGTINGTTVTWSARQVISTGTGLYDGRVAADSQGNAHIVWLSRKCGASSSVANVYYRERFANGTLGPESAPIADCLGQDRPHVTVTSGGTVHVVFQHAGEAYYGRKESTGWTTQNISNNASNSTNPRIATNGTQLFYSWDNDTPGNVHDIFVKYSNDGGNTWSSPIGIGERVGNEADAFMSWNAGTNRMYIVWDDNTDGSGGRADIFAREMDTSGALTDPIRLTCDLGSSKSPIIATSGNQAEVVWQALVNGTWTVYGISAQIGNGLSTTGCAPVAPGLPTATPTPGGPASTNTPTVTPLPTYTPIPTDTPALTATPGCTNCYFRPPYLLDDEPKQEDYIFYIVFAAVYIMTIHFAIAISKEFKIHLMVACFVLGFVVGYFMKSLTVGFVVAIVLSLFLW